MSRWLNLIRMKMLPAALSEDPLPSCRVEGGCGSKPSANGTRPCLGLPSPAPAPQAQLQVGPSPRRGSRQAHAHAHTHTCRDTHDTRTHTYACTPVHRDPSTSTHMCTHLHRHTDTHDWPHACRQTHAALSRTQAAVVASSCSPLWLKRVKLPYSSSGENTSHSPSPHPSL